MLTVGVLRCLFAVVLTLSGLTQMSYGAEYEHGRVSMNGSILDSTCSIDTSLENQVVLMKTVPVGQMLRDGQSEPTSLSIWLVGCDTRAEASHFKVTFYGAQGNNNTFLLSGETKGIGMRLVDREGNEIRPGVPMAIAQTTTESNKLEYTLTLKGDGDTLTPGTYQTTLRMKLEYY